MKTRTSRTWLIVCFAGAFSTAAIPALSAPTAPVRGVYPKAANADELTDGELLQVAEVLNTGEVEQAEVATRRGTVASVKDFANMMKKDHGAARDRGRELAKELGLTPKATKKSRSIQKDGEDLREKLEKAPATTFDRTYLEEQVRLHDKALKVVSELGPTADDENIRRLFSDMRGHVEHHLAVAKRSLAMLPNP